MLGSLVIVYPTAHQGGELVFHHKEREWTFDANFLTSLQPSPSLAYVAFYSDIEHEVLKVTSGSRVTLTYNLYLVPHGPTPGAPVPSNLPVGSVKPNLKDVTNFQATLRRLLKSPEFMPEGGTLAFNLAHLSLPDHFRHGTPGNDRIPQRRGRTRVPIVSGVGAQTRPAYDIQR